MTLAATLRFAALVTLGLGLASPALGAGSTARARELIDSQGCRGCHRIDGRGGDLGPALDNVGKHLSRKQLAALLKNPQAAHPGSMMPSYAHLPPRDLQALVDYLAREK